MSHAEWSALDPGYGDAFDYDQSRPAFLRCEGDPEAFLFNLVGTIPTYRATMMAHVLAGTGVVVMANSGFQTLQIFTLSDCIYVTTNPAITCQ